MPSADTGPAPGAFAARHWLDSDIVYSFLHSPLAVAAAVAFVIMVAGAFLAPWLAPTDPFDIATLDLMDSRLPPAWVEGGEARFLLGTDDQGADVLSSIMYGARISILVGVLSVLVSMLIGVPLGLWSGFVGGRIDAVVMRSADVQLTFPAILIALLIGGITASLLSSNLRTELAIPVIVFALGIAHWPHFARLVRGETLVERNKDYVAAARLIGRGRLHIMVREVLPNALNPVLVLATLDFGFAILGEATLSFLGLGVPVTQPSLGTLIRFGYAYLFSGEWWVVIFPSLALVALVLTVNILGDWLRDALNPKLR